MKWSLLLFLGIISVSSWGQNIDYNKIILPSSSSLISFEERLVQLGWKNHPANAAAAQNVQMFKREKNLATFSWLDGFSATFNANQFTIDPSSDILNRSAFYPRYNFSLRFTLSTIFLTPTQSKIANDKIVVGELQVNEMKLAVRREILSNLELLKERYKLLRLRDRLKEDFLVLFNDAEKKFSNGDIKIDQYQLASQAYYTRAEAVISASSLFNQSKIELEAIIGLKLEDIEGYNDFLNKLEAEIKVN